MEKRIMLIGRMGTGKSATGNLIVGRNVFESETSLNSVTRNCNIHIFRGTNPALPGDQDFMVIDTPGYFCKDTPFKDRALEIQRYIIDHSSMPHAFLLIFSLKKAPDFQDKDTLDMLRILFGEQVFEHCIVVFTHAKAIRSDEEFSTYWQNDLVLKEIVEKCNGRVARVENCNLNDSDDEDENEGNDPDDEDEIEGNHLGPLLGLIDTVSRGGKCAYSNPNMTLHKQFLESLSAANDHNVPRLAKDLKDFLWKRKWIKVAKYVVLSLGIASIGAVGAKLSLVFLKKVDEFLKSSINEKMALAAKSYVDKHLPKAIEKRLPKTEVIAENVAHEAITVIERAIPRLIEQHLPNTKKVIEPILPNPQQIAENAAKEASKTVTQIIPASRQVVVKKEGMAYPLAGITAASSGVAGALIGAGALTGNPVLAGFGAAWAAFSAFGAWLGS